MTVYTVEAVLPEKGLFARLRKAHRIHKLLLYPGCIGVLDYQKTENRPAIALPLFPTVAHLKRLLEESVGVGPDAGKLTLDEIIIEATFDLDTKKLTGCHRLNQAEQEAGA